MFLNNDIKFNSHAYCGKNRFSSFWHQYDEIFASLKEKDDKVLEVGVGSKVLKCLLENFQVNYTSIDIDAGNKPDYIGSVTEMPFNDNSFEIACCFQVLEHIPYNFFEKSLSELFRIASRAVIVSLPNASRSLRLKIQNFQYIMSQDFFLKPDCKNHPVGHLWEINRKSYPISRIMNSINNSMPDGYFLEKSYRVFGNPYHHFFVFKSYKERQK